MIIDMLELKENIALLDTFLDKLGDRAAFRENYAAALGKTIQGDVLVVRSELFAEPHYLGKLLFEDAASVLLLFQRTGIITYEDLPAELKRREENVDDWGLWLEGYNEREDALIHFLDFTNFYDAEVMRKVGNGDVDWIPDYDYAGGCRTEKYAEVWRGMSNVQKARFLASLDKSGLIAEDHR